MDYAIQKVLELRVCVLCWLRAEWNQEVYSLPSCLLLLIRSVSMFYFTHLWINGLLSKQSSLQVVWGRQHSTIMVLVSYKNTFSSEVCNHRIVTDVSFRPNWRIHFCLRSCQKRALSLHIRNSEQGGNVCRQLLQRRCSVPPGSVRGISGRMKPWNVLGTSGNWTFSLCPPSGLCALLGVCWRGFDLQYCN